MVFRIPGNEDMINAFGRAIWNCHYIEETAASLLYVGGHDLTRARSLSMKDKVTEIRALARARGESSELSHQLRLAAESLDTIRTKHRNALAHASQFTAEVTADGEYRAGVALSYRDGTRTVLDGPKQMLQLAKSIEELGEPIFAAYGAMIESDELKSGQEVGRRSPQVRSQRS